MKGKLQNCNLWQKSSKSMIVKAGNQFSGYVSNFAQNQKHKRSLKPTAVNFVLKRELDSSSFSVSATKLFHIAGPRIGIRKLILRSVKSCS